MCCQGTFCILLLVLLVYLAVKWGNADVKCQWFNCSVHPKSHDAESGYITCHKSMRGSRIYRNEAVFPALLYFDFMTPA